MPSPQVTAQEYARIDRERDWKRVLRRCECRLCSARLAAGYEADTGDVYPAHTSRPQRVYWSDPRLETETFRPEFPATPEALMGTGVGTSEPNPEQVNSLYNWITTNVGNPLPRLVEPDTE